jgi:capsular polysaccharide transport system ATP-binding protein
MIEFDGVSKSFWTGTQRKVILDRASFRVELGKSIGILAPNGAGKTTIINMMAGLEKPDEGTITRLARVVSAGVHGRGERQPHSAKENCRYIARLYGLDPDYVESFCRWVCGLGNISTMPLTVLFLGMKSRFTFSLLLAIEFDIYLIDEGMPSTSPMSSSTARPATSCANGCQMRP